MHFFRGASWSLRSHGATAWHSQDASQAHCDCEQGWRVESWATAWLHLAAPCRGLYLLRGPHRLHGKEPTGSLCRTHTSLRIVPIIQEPIQYVYFPKRLPDLLTTMNQAFYNNRWSSLVLAKISKRKGNKNHIPRFIRRHRWNPYRCPIRQRQLQRSS
jgi:hypothetical protein